MNLTHEDVMGLIQQRDPILLVDTAENLVPGESITSHFYVKPDMAIFEGHFPGNPVFPGVYTMEACAQTVCCMYQSTERYKGTVSLYLGIDGAKFKKMIKPGDTIDIVATPVKEREDKAIVTAHTVVYVGEDVCAEADVSLAFR